MTRRRCRPAPTGRGGLRGPIGGLEQGRPRPARLDERGATPQEDNAGLEGSPRALRRPPSWTSGDPKPPRAGPGGEPTPPPGHGPGDPGPPHPCADRAGAPRLQLTSWRVTDPRSSTAGLLTKEVLTDLLVQSSRTAARTRARATVRPDRAAAVGSARLAAGRARSSWFKTLPLESGSEHVGIDAKDPAGPPPLRRGVFGGDGFRAARPAPQRELAREGGRGVASSAFPAGQIASSVAERRATRVDALLPVPRHHRLRRIRFHSRAMGMPRCLPRARRSDGRRGRRQPRARGRGSPDDGGRVPDAGGSINDTVVITTASAKPRQRPTITAP